MAKVRPAGRMRPSKLFLRPLSVFLVIKQRKLSTVASHIPFHYLNTNKLAAPRTFKVNENGP